ncbi:MAG: FAD-dependent oxidoreductase [Planctomycetes bacterium]|jgi:predicted NAD/FAD-binding protein|nr:FAD-dependent oxidoreductase [Planctomycetota bacterium]
MTAAARFLGAGRKRLAIVGTGISGLVAAERLCRAHDVVVYEREGRIGGHTHTVDVDGPHGKVAVDTGFIVCNDRTYPGFLALLQRLGVPLRKSEMSFSVRCERTGLEYNGGGFNQIFAQRRNLLRPRFLGMLRDILRFHRQAPAFGDSDATLQDVLQQGRFGRAFAEHYLVPMMAAIWSAEPHKLMAMPARFFVRFFHNHGMLTVADRPQWYTVQGGSRSYLGPLTAPFASAIRTDAPVVAIRRTADAVWVKADGQPEERFDGAVLATHSDQALAMLRDATPAEMGLLGAIPYQQNDVVLHTDARLLPVRQRAWAAWNYHLPKEPVARATVTYSMNILQGLAGPEHYLVTLNRTAAIDPQRVLRKFVYEHPVFDARGVQAQAAVAAQNGHGRIWLCGAWCGFGFHEDGVQAGLRVAADFGLGDDVPATGRIG